MREFDYLNEKLKDEIKLLKNECHLQMAEIERLGQENEQNMIKWNLSLNEKDSKIEELMTQRKEETNFYDEPDSMTPELDDLADKEGGLVAVRRQVENAVRIIQSCEECRVSLSDRLKEAATQLRTLSFVISGNENSDFMTKKNLLSRCESDEAILSSSSYNDEDEEENSSVLNDLTMIQLGELRDKLVRMEEELNLVTEESKSLQIRLSDCESNLEKERETIKVKDEEIRDLRDVKFKINEELEKQKNKLGNISKERIVTKEQMDHKCRNKDFLIRNLADFILSNNFRASAVVNKLRETTCKPSITDFNLDSLCHFLENNSKKNNISENNKDKVDELKKGIVDESVNLPKNLRIVRSVGLDSILLAWMTPMSASDNIELLVYNDKKLIHRIKHVSRGKSMVHGLNLDSQFTLEITAVSTLNQDKISESIFLNYPLN